LGDFNYRISLSGKFLKILVKLIKF